MTPLRPSLAAAVVVPLVAIGWCLAAPAASQDAAPWDVSWKNATRIASPDGAIIFKIGGRLQADLAFADTSDDLEDGIELRRVRSFIEGTLYDRFELKVEVDFAGGDARAADIYMGLINLPVLGGVRVGHFKEPFGLEELTSSKYITFLERSFPIEAFAPARNMGLMVHDQAGASDRLNWAVGLFKDTDDFGTALADEWNLTARLSGLALDSDDGRRLLHLGAAYSARSPNENEARFRARPQSHLAPRTIDTGTLMTGDVDLLGLEAAFVAGPLWAQAERIEARTAAPAKGDLSGVTVQAGWFLTGESRSYKRQGGVFDRVTPKRSWLEGGGSGAWELALRYSDLDLSDGQIAAGGQDGLTLALNWYPTTFGRVMLNLASTDLENGASADFALLRFQVEF